MFWCERIPRLQRSADFIASSPWLKSRVCLLGLNPVIPAAVVRTEYRYTCTRSPGVGTDGYKGIGESLSNCLCTPAEAPRSEYTRELARLHCNRRNTFKRHDSSIFMFTLERSSVRKSRSSGRTARCCVHYPVSRQNILRTYCAF